MDPEQEFTYAMYCGDGGDGDSSGGSDSTDTGDMGSESANNASTSSGEASVGGGDSGGGVDTGDFGSEAANVAATEAANASVGIGDTDAINAVNVSLEPDFFATGLPPANAVDPGIATDTIASFTNNLQAQMQSNPIGFALSPLGTSLMTAYQTAQANSMMNPSSGFSSQPSNGESGDVGYSDLVPLAPYLLGGSQIQPSKVSEYFSNLQNQQPTGGILSRYDDAKQNISGILGTNNQLGSSNTSNIYYNYLNEKGLL